MVLEHGEADAVERGLGGGKLLQDVQTDARLLHHATDAADLPFDAVEAGDEALLLRVVQHGSLENRLAALTLYAASVSRGCSRAHDPRRRPSLSSDGARAVQAHCPYRPSANGRGRLRAARDEGKTGE